MKKRRECEYCDKYYFASKNQRFCSIRCVRLYQRSAKIIKKCEYCSEEFITDNKNQDFCCQSCWTLYKRKKKKKLKRKCKYCHNDYIVKVKHQKFCSIHCGRLYRANKRKKGKPTKPYQYKGSAIISELQNYKRFISESRLSSLKKGIHRHHIIPRCLGGEDNQDNIAFLNDSDHLKAHQLLAKVYPDHCQLVAVVNLMKKWFS